MVWKWILVLLVVACADVLPVEPDLARNGQVVGVRVVPSSLRLEVGMSASVSCQVQQRNGKWVSGKSCSWAAVDATIVTLVPTVGASTRVTARRIGATRIRATYAGHTNGADVVVEDPPPSDTTGAEAREADDFVNSIGVNVHLGYTDRKYYTEYATLTRPKILALGVKHLRDHSTDTSIWWHDEIRDRVNELGTQGVKFSWIGDPRSPGTADPAHAVAWGRSTATATAQVEGPNEWDLSQPNDASWVTSHRTYLEGLYDLWNADAVTTQFPVAGPSHFEAEITPPLLGDVSQWLDYMNLHAYPFPDPPENDDDYPYQYNNFKTIYGDKPVMVTETGYHTSGVGSDRPVSEDQQRKWTPRIALHYWNQGVVRTYFYELLDQCTDTTNRECGFGLVRYDGSDKPAYTAMQTLLTLLDDPGVAFTPSPLSYTLGGTLSSVHTTLLQKRSGRFYLMAWLSSSTTVTRDLTLSFPTAKAQIRQYHLDSTTPFADTISVSSLGITVSDEVTVIEITP